MCVALLLVNLAGVLWVNAANNAVHAQIRKIISIYENTGLSYDEFRSRIRDSGLNHSITQADDSSVISISLTASHYPNETLRIVYHGDTPVTKAYITPDAVIDPAKVVLRLTGLLKSNTLFNSVDFAFLNSAVIFVFSVIRAVRPLAPVSREQALLSAALFGTLAFALALVSRALSVTVGCFTG
jgi:hypothetical protein